MKEVDTLVDNINLIEFLINTLMTLPAIIIAITFHEIAHGYSAYKLGDPTAKNAGRLTLNPLVHLDVFGFLCLIIFKFGWAKPVPIDSSYLKKRKRDTIIISVSGPLMNFFIALLATLVFTIIVKFNISHVAIMMIEMIIIYNLSLGIFNLLPFPPLDGSKIIASLLPIKHEVKFYQYEKYLHLVLIFLLVSGSIDKILDKWLSLSINILSTIVISLIS